MNKFLYSLGCTCDPHVSWQTSLKEYVAPSIFAGLIQLQEESSKFIPQFLFDGSLENHFFQKDKWQQIERVDCGDGIFRIPQDNQYFKYCFNLQQRKFLNNINTSCRIINPEIYYNEKLHLLNIHAKDKTPGVNPRYIDYQYKKYEYFQANKYDLKFGILLHRSVTRQQLLEFQQMLLQQHFDLSNFVVFIRNQSFNEELKFHIVSMPYGNDEQSNPYYGFQRKIMIDFVNSNWI